MTYVPHWRATFKGGFYASGSNIPYEEWNTSLAFRPGTVREWIGGSEAAVEDLATDFKDFFVALGPAISASTRLDEVRLDSIASNGKIDQKPRLVDLRPQGISGGGLMVLPPQCAVVLTLDTEVRGRSRFGRMYLPLLGVTVGDGGIMGQAQAASLADKAAAFMTAAGNAPNVDLDWAPVVASGVGSGTLNEVKSVRIGRAIDTMRSRRRDLAERYESRDVTV